MKRTGNILILLLITIIATSCDGGDRDRIPAAAVRVEFANQAMWDQYGVSGSFIHRRFILNQKIPAGFPYTLSSATGYGGLMLITNEHGVPYVYDLCCPVEINSNIRIEFDENNLCLRCPKCGSTLFRQNGKMKKIHCLKEGCGFEKAVPARKEQENDG